MNGAHKLEHEADGFSVMSLALGLIGALLTALVHMQIMTSPHFDFLIWDKEFFLVLGFVVVISALALGDLKAGASALHHLNEPHTKYTKSVALASISIGVVDLLPALIILAILAETLFLRLIQISIVVN